ncbi:hypothetical protein CC86DRAFT_444692 [Ophiobolus disseminans]|uniref:Uncharacterized protein n=1 Tax=Ophiobolus disseminans TaxID=1469910 RepID=A0A6A7A5P9_9PLEO|nr:hypothetical protein CC86DRAFT_444692 [Ophiobolus disseminans]
MDPSKGKARHTNIIDDTDAIARVMQAGQRRPQPKKKNAGGFNLAALQNAGVSKFKLVKKSPATPNAGPRFFEEDGLKIPLYDKSGKRKATARASKGLRNKNLDQLLDIVEEYAGAGKRKQFKDADVTKSEIADWIEAAETRALPPNPLSKLPAVPEADYEVDPKDPLWNDAPKGTNTDAKRKHDNAPEPAQASQQTPKKPKTHHADGQKVKQSPAGHKQKHGQARCDTRKVRFEEPLQEPTAHPPEEMTPEEIPTVSTKHDGDTEEQARKAENLARFLHDVRMHPEDPDGSSKVVHLTSQSEARILTASTLKTGRTVLHNTPIPQNQAKRHITLSQPARAEAPFVKKGRHGRHADFAHDPDRRFGRGHQFTREDEQGLEEYFSYSGQVLKEYPKYPRIGEHQGINPGVEDDWKENESWYRRFSRKYPGHAVAHLWPCGCERVRGGSEGEESEEE